MSALGTSGYPIRSLPIQSNPTTSSLQTHQSLRILINHITDTHRGRNLQQIRRHPSKQPNHPLPPNRLPRHIPHPTISRRMQHRALGLQPCPQQIQGIHYRRADSAGERSDGAGGDIADGDVLLVAAVEAGLARQEEVLQVLEDEEVDRRVGEHAQQAHAEATVVGKDAGGRGEHFGGGGADERVAVEAAGDGFALHATRRSLEQS
jgi:hypothetical protein